MTLSPRAYLAKKGAIELLCEISPQGSRFGDLEDSVSISPPTLKNRLTQGQEVSLLKARTLAGERGTTHEYVLTPRGATIRTLLFERDVVLDYRQYRRARKQFERSRAEFIDAVDTDTAYLGDDEVNEKNLKTLLDRKAFSELVEDADDS